MALSLEFRGTAEATELNSNLGTLLERYLFTYCIPLPLPGCCTRTAHHTCTARSVDTLRRTGNRRCSANPVDPLLAFLLPLTLNGRHELAVPQKIEKKIRQHVFCFFQSLKGVF